MQDHVSAIMLAGTISPTPFQEALGIPVLCLPIGRSGCVLDAWVRTLGTAGQPADVRLVVKSPKELERVSAAVAGLKRTRAKMNIHAQRERGAWRGVAGLLRDLREESPAKAGLMLVLEAHSYPPDSVAPLFDSLRERRDAMGVIGVTDGGEPAGVHLFRREAFDDVPAVGYYDLKEQLLPDLYNAGRTVVTVRLAERMQRMRDLSSYLKSVRRSLTGPADATGALTIARRVSPQANVSPKAMLEGCCIIEPEAVIEDGAVVHDSVVLRGAAVGGGAVVSRSVIGPTVRVKPRTKIIRDVIPTPQERLEDVMQLIDDSAEVSAA